MQLVPERNSEINLSFRKSTNLKILENHFDIIGLYQQKKFFNPVKINVPLKQENINWFSL